MSLPPASVFGCLATTALALCLVLALGGAWAARDTNKAVGDTPPRNYSEGIQGVQGALISRLAPKVAAGGSPVALHIGPYRLQDHEVAFYKGLYEGLGGALRLVLVEPQGSALRDLREQLRGAGIADAQVRTEEAAVCGRSRAGRQTFFHFRAQLEEFSGLDAAEALRAVRARHGELLRAWGIFDWGAEDWLRSGELEEQPVSCRTVSDVLSEVGVATTDLDVVLVQARGHCVDIVEDLLMGAEVAPGFLLFCLDRGDDDAALRAALAAGGYGRSLVPDASSGGLPSVVAIPQRREERLPLGEAPSALLEVEEDVVQLLQPKRRPGVLHIGPSSLRPEEVDAYSTLSRRVGGRLRMVFVEPQVAARSQLRQQLSHAGLGAGSVRTLEAAACLDDGELRLNGFSPKFFSDFPNASHPDVNFRNLHALQPRQPLESARQRRARSLEEWGLSNLTDEDFNSRGYLQAVATRCLSPASVLREVGWQPQDVDVLIIDAEGISDPLADQFLSLEGLSPSFLMSKEVLTEPTLLRWQGRPCYEKDAGLVCLRYFDG